MNHKSVDAIKTSEVLRKKFEEKKMTNKMIAEEFDVSISTVFYWLNGKKTPSLNHLVAIADVLDCDIGELVVTK
jgi:transcriptional regulator with XRE-family HTH domain